jgi:hypothetical protein
MSHHDTKHGHSTLLLLSAKNKRTNITKQSLIKSTTPPMLPIKKPLINNQTHRKLGLEGTRI